MTDRDPTVTRLLDELIPDVHEPREWDALVEKARLASENGARVQHRRFGSRTALRRRVLLMAVLVVLVVLVPLAALAVGQGWWFLSAYTPKPAGKIVQITSGRWDGVAWNLTGFHTTTGALCYSMTANPARPLVAASAEACGQIGEKAITLLRNTGQPQLPTTRGQTRSPRAKEATFPGYVLGTAPPAASEIDIEAPDGDIERVPTLPAPGDLHTRLRFFIAQRPTGDDVRRLVARGTNGDLIAATDIDSPYSLKRYHLSNPGKKLALTRAAIHQLRLHHRSPDIYLLANRDGQSLYRLGTSGRCFGAGKSANLSWKPPARVMHLVGVIACSRAGFSPISPIRDLSIWGQTRGQKVMSVYRLSGIASNEVIALDLVDPNGAVVERVPVIGSVYDTRPAPASIVSIVPVNAGGVWLSPCGFGKGAYLVSGCFRPY